MYSKILIFLSFLISLNLLECTETNLLQEVPSAYKGRFRPLDATARLWLQENYHRQSIKSSHYNDFHLTGSSALSLLWKIQFLGYQSWDDIPLFWIHSAHLKTLLDLPVKDDYFSYQQLLPSLSRIAQQSSPDIQLNKQIQNLLQAVQQFSQLKGPYAQDENDYETVYQVLVQRQIPPQKIAEFLEEEYPLSQRLANAGLIFKVLPAKNGEWYSLNALAMNTYNSEKNDLEPISNFTLYPDEQFEKIRNVYFKLIAEHDNIDYKRELTNLLLDNYRILENQPIQKAWEKSLNYPSFEKLKVEYWYYQLPLIETTILFYGVSILLLLIGLNQKKRGFTKLGTFFTLVAFSLNTLILAMRCFILGRPPVSNMFETVIYVPWIAVLTSLLLTAKMKNPLILLGASTVAVILLILLKMTGLAESLENVQAVLDSQFWLIIHVLMIVGSYGVFALAGILGHIYLFQYLIHKHETFDMEELGKGILQALYVGVALLIPGTILGGVWAAQSWGRFWDWDPKESWAFISSCVYLIFIHAFRFKHIHYFGLAIGSVVGLLVISFTWYGVNYILATGLHSYGFASGGEIYYGLFILAELLFLMTASLVLMDKGTKDKDVA